MAALQEAAALDTRRRDCFGLSCGSELWRCPEMLFQPRIAGKSLPEQVRRWSAVGTAQCRTSSTASAFAAATAAEPQLRQQALQQISNALCGVESPQVFAAVGGCEIDLRRTLLKNIVLAGGTTWCDRKALVTAA